MPVLCALVKRAASSTDDIIVLEPVNKELREAGEGQETPSNMPLYASTPLRTTLAVELETTPVYHTQSAPDSIRVGELATDPADTATVTKGPTRVPPAILVTGAGDGNANCGLTEGGSNIDFAVSEHSKGFGSVQEPVFAEVRILDDPTVRIYESDSELSESSRSQEGERVDKRSQAPGAGRVSEADNGPSEIYDREDLQRSDPTQTGICVREESDTAAQVTEETVTQTVADGLHSPPSDIVGDQTDPLSDSTKKQLKLDLNQLRESSSVEPTPQPKSTPRFQSPVKGMVAFTLFTLVLLVVAAYVLFESDLTCAGLDSVRQLDLVQHWDAVYYHPTRERLAQLFKQYL